MLFNSWQFAVFFPLVTLLYFVLPQAWRWGLLLAASCWFYACFVPAYLLILGGTIVVDYAAGLLMERYPRHKRPILWASILSNVGCLFFFKYFNFVNAHVTWLAGALGWHNPVGTLDILLPIGLSFHTFQAMSYTIEVYRGVQAAERHLGIYALYVMFYPQLVAGPIERPQNMLHQFRERHCFDENRVTSGLRLMLWGAIKKIVIADRLAIPVGLYFSHPAEFRGLAPAAAIVMFAFQIYCDFSGYCDIALGAAQVMGFRLMTNFDRPYFARSIGEFWRRWHISLSTWFRDYVYLPLGGSRVRRASWARNVLVVFMLSGLWHGANWTYVVWGALHGMYLLAGQATQPLRARMARFTGLASWPRLHAAWQVAVTFTLVCIGWIFFRAVNVAQAWFVCRKAVDGIWAVVRSGTRWSPQLDSNFQLLFSSRADMWACFGLVVGLLIVETLQRQQGFSEWLAARAWPIRWASYQTAVIAIVLFGQVEARQFIYFQF